MAFRTNSADRPSNLNPNSISENSSNPIPEFDSLRLNSTPQLASPFVTPETSDMDTRSNTSSESGELQDHLLKGKCEDSPIDLEEVGSIETPNTLHSDDEKNTAAPGQVFNLVNFPNANSTNISTSGQGNIASPFPIDREDYIARLQAAKLGGGKVSAKTASTQELHLENDSNTIGSEPHHGRAESVAALDTHAQLTGGKQEIFENVNQEKGVTSKTSDEQVAIQRMKNGDAGLQLKRNTVNGVVNLVDDLPVSEQEDEVKAIKEQKHEESGASTHKHVHLEQHISKSSDDSEKFNPSLNARKNMALNGSGHTASPTEIGQPETNEYLNVRRSQQMLPHTPFPRRLPGLQASRHFAPNTPSIQTPDTYRGYRQPYQPYHRQPNSRLDDIQDQLMRTQAQLLATRDKLEHERQTNLIMRHDTEQEVQKNSETALHSMINHLFHKQCEVAANSTALAKKEAALSHREALIQQLEAFLALGQQRLVHELDKNGIHAPSTQELEHAREQGKLDALHQQHLRHLELDAQEKQLRCRETTLRLREKQFKAQVQYALEASIRSTLEPEIEVRVGKAEYERGFAVGKVAGHVERTDEVHRAGFLEGYRTCNETREMLAKIRAGKIALGGPEMEFLTDPEHPRNPFNVGLQIGKLQMQMQAHKTVQEDSQPQTNGVTSQIGQMEVDKTPPAVSELRTNGVPAYINGSTPNPNGGKLFRYELSNEEPTSAAERTPRGTSNARRPDVQVHVQDEKIDLIDLY